MFGSFSGAQRRSVLRFAAIAVGLAISWPLAAAEVIKIGLVTALSGQSAKAGEAITRGLTIAVDEINAKGGVLGGRKFELVRRDDEANPAKGQIAARELLFKEKVAVLFGGLDSPVALAIVPIVNQEKVPFMDPWAAGTPITRNGANPNFVFRVSAMDELVDKRNAAIRAEELQRQDPRHHRRQQSVGRVQPEGPARGAQCQGRQACRRREVRAQRRRRDAAFVAAQGRRRR